MVLLIAIFACSSKDSFLYQDEISLIAPNGMKISNSISDINNLIIKYLIHPNEDFNSILVRKIEYLDSKEYRLCAIITYQVDNLLSANFEYCSDFTIGDTNTSKNTKGQTSIIMRCVASGSCQTPCAIKAIMDPETGTQIATCECAQCILETIIE